MSNIGFRVIADFNRPRKELIEKFKYYSTVNITDNVK